MRGSRQNSRRATKSVEIIRSRRPLTTHLVETSFIRKFEGKINIVTRETGLRGILMKTIKHLPRADQSEIREELAESRVMTQAVDHTITFRTIPHTIQNKALGGKENRDTLNAQISRRGGETEPLEMRQAKEKLVSPFNLPPLARPKTKIMKQKWRITRDAAKGSEKQSIKLR